MIVTREELINVFKYIVKKCDMLINNGNYEADAYTQDTVEDIAELCNHILDGDYGKLIEVKEADLEKYLKEDIEDVFFDLDGVAVKGATHYLTVEDIKDLAKHFYSLGLKAQKGE